MTLAAVDLRPSEREVLAALRGRGAVSPVEIERLLPHRDARTIRTARARLLELGLVVVSGTPSRPRVALAAGGEPAVPDPDATRARTGCNPGPDPDARAVSSSVRRLQVEVEAAAAAASLKGSGSGWIAEAVRGLVAGVEALAGLLRAQSGHRPLPGQVDRVDLAPRPEGAGLEHRFDGAGLRPRSEDTTASPANKPVGPLEGPTRITGHSAGSQITRPSEGPRTERHGCAAPLRAQGGHAGRAGALVPRPEGATDLDAAVAERVLEHEKAVAAGKAVPVASPSGWLATVRRRLAEDPVELAAVLERRRVRLAREASAAEASERKTVSREARAADRERGAEEQRKAIEARRRLDGATPEQKREAERRAESSGRRRGSVVWNAAVERELEALVG